MASILLLFLIWISTIYNQISRASWIVSNDPLPRSDDEYAIGEHNGTILLIGGSVFAQQGVGIDIDSQKVTDLGEQVLPVPSSGGKGQFWTQQAHIIYIIEESTFNTFDVTTHQYTTNWQGLQFNYVDRTGCLASSDAFLYVIGGKDTNDIPINLVQILSLSTYSWMSDPPSLQVVREKHACLVHNGYLWAFGGEDTSGDGIPSNERILTTNIALNTWHFVDSLSEGLVYHRAASWSDAIYIVGGKREDDTVVNWVHLVDANTGTITMFSDNLPWSCDRASPIIIDAIFYVFGCDSAFDEWAYYTLPTPYPTQKPSSNPSLIPTEQPSNNPSPIPTEKPTELPSAMPSDMPVTKVPTMPLHIYDPTESQSTTHRSTETHLFLTSMSTQQDMTWTGTIGHRADNNETNNNEDIPLFVLIAICAVSMIAVVFVFACVCYSHNQKKRAHETEGNVVTMSNVQENTATNDGLRKMNTNMDTDAKTRNVKGVEVVHVTNGINTERVMKGSVNVAKGSEGINDLNVNKSPGGESGDIDLNHGEESQDSDTFDSDELFNPGGAELVATPL
eukprot:930551_1